MPDIRRILLLAALPISLLSAADDAGGRLKVITSWIGNTYEGAGQNGSGRWVQDMINGMRVASDGTVFTASDWDEAGRCSGLYRDGQVNARLLQQYDGHKSAKAWGWGTSGRAVAIEGQQLFLTNGLGDLMRFSWTPGDLNSAHWHDQVEAGKALSMVARGPDLVVIGENGRISIRAIKDMAEKSSFIVPAARDVAIDAHGTLWILAGREIIHRAMDGSALPGRISDAGSPSAISIDARNRLIVCDDGPRQQILFYALGDTPVITGHFGDSGGLRSGTPGLVTPTKLWGLQGAGADAAGNLYVASCIGPLQACGTAIRSFTSTGQLRWEEENLAWVECYSFDPASDGRLMYGPDAIISFDPSQPPGRGWKLRAITLDPIRYPDDPRLHGQHGTTGILRRLQGRRLLADIGQMSGGMDLYAFEPDPSDVAHFAMHVGPSKDGGWAWQIDAAGTIWCGDAPGKTIQCWKFAGWNPRGLPMYDLKHPQSWPWPAGFTGIGRVAYVPATDTLYIAGFTPDRKPTSWGLIGSVLARYDAWSTGHPRKRWEIDLPVDDEHLQPKSMDIAGAYAFTVAVKSTQGHPAQVSVFRLSDGASMGHFIPGPEVGGNSGWVDQSHGIQACRCADGEYRVLVEEDWRGKNLLYRWRPAP